LTPGVILPKFSRKGAKELSFLPHQLCKRLYFLQGCESLRSSGIAILSIHGGDIEPGTTRIANAIAGWDHSFYTFEGIKTARNLSLHITSTRFDEPSAM